jgi:hypothetical protein
MSKMLDQFIEYARGHEAVQFYPCIDIANFWLEREGIKFYVASISNSDRTPVASHSSTLGISI